MTMSRLVLAFVALLSVSCRDATGPSVHDLSEAMQRWQRNQPAGYEVTTSIACFCTPESQRPVIMTVQHGVVVGLRYADGGPPFYDASHGRPPTVEELFAQVAEAIESADHVAATYDPYYGHPRTVAIDHSFGMADDEVWYTMSALRPL